MEVKGACRCREIPLSVPMLHARSTSGLTGGSKMRNFPLLAKGDVRVLIDRHKAANVIARRRRIPYVVNVNGRSSNATWIKGVLRGAGTLYRADCQSRHSTLADYDWDTRAHRPRENPTGDSRRQVNSFG